MIIHIHYTYVPSYLSIYQPCMSMVENVWDWMVGEHARPLNQYRTSFFSSSFSSHGNPLNLVSASKPPRVSILKRPGKLNTKFKPKCFDQSSMILFIVTFLPVCISEEVRSRPTDGLVMASLRVCKYLIVCRHRPCTHHHHSFPMCVCVHP